MRTEKAGWWIATAAIVVQAPRLVLAVLAADRLPVGAGWEGALLVVAGCGTAVVLTGGNLYLMHAVARTRCWRGGLLLLWLVVLGSTGAMVVPKIAAGFFGRPFTGVLQAEWLGWAWSAVAALAHEVTAAGCVLSAAALARTADAAGEERRESAAVAELLGQRDAARREAEALRQEPRLSAQEVRLVAPQSAGAEVDGGRLGARSSWSESGGSGSGWRGSGGTEHSSGWSGASSRRMAGGGDGGSGRNGSAGHGSRSEEPRLSAQDVRLSMPPSAGAEGDSGRLGARSGWSESGGGDGSGSTDRGSGWSGDGSRRMAGGSPAGSGGASGSDAAVLGVVANDMASLAQAAAERAIPGAAGAAAGGAQVFVCREGCGRRFGSRLAEMGHLRHCPVRQERQRRSAAAGP